MAKIFTGRIISTKMQKTVIVLVERKFRHSIYKKVISRHNKYKAHNEKLKLKEGDWVKIKETRPRSKDKYFNVVEKVKS